MFLSHRDLLVSDAEREAVADFLKRHYATGRLTGPELADRVDAAYRARRESQLAVLVADLPAISEPARRPRLRLPLPALLVALALLAGTVMVLDAMPGEMAVLFVAIALPMLVMLAFMLAPLAALALGIAWIVRVATRPPRHSPTPHL